MLITPGSCKFPRTVAGYLQQLVMCKMQLAELNDSYLSTCHELHKAKEKNLAIAAKMTRYLDTQSCLLFKLLRHSTGQLCWGPRGSSSVLTQISQEANCIRAASAYSRFCVHAQKHTTGCTHCALVYCRQYSAHLSVMSLCHLSAMLHLFLTMIY